MLIVRGPSFRPYEYIQPLTIDRPKQQPGVDAGRGNKETVFGRADPETKDGQ